MFKNVSPLQQIKTKLKEKINVCQLVHSIFKFSILPNPGKASKLEAWVLDVLKLEDWEEENDDF